VLPRRRPEEAEQLLDEITHGTGIGFAPLKLAEAAALVREAAARTEELGLELPADARPAVQLLARINHRDDDALEEPLPLAASPDLEQLRALLARPEYAQSWFFDRGDLQSTGQDLPEGSADLAVWAASVAGRLDRPALRSRLGGMARHMARWHRWKGESELAQLCSAAARVTEKDFANSPLVAAMLERSLVPADEEPGAPTLDRSMLRQHLKGLFFQHIHAPKGRDLARLDFAEAALVFLEESFLGLPGERRPREDEATTAAFAIGKLFADFLIAGAHGSIERVIGEMDQALQKYCHLDENECGRVVAVVLPALGDFMERHCAECPAACIDRPAADVSELFFAPHHPARRRPRRPGGDADE
jgi:hypothetical protein